MPPFDQKFDTRHDIPGMIFSEAVQMLLYHELAHIGGGHLDLNVANPQYGRNIDVQITEEDEADNQAICWLLGVRFLEAQTNILEASSENLKEELATSILQFIYYILGIILGKREYGTRRPFQITDIKHICHIN